MEQLPSALLQVILGKVPAPDCASAAFVARDWNQVAYQESLWESHCRSDFPLLQGGKLDPFDRPCASWKVMSLTNRILPPLTWFRRHIIIAASSNLNKFFLNCEDGNVYVGTRNLLVDAEMMVCAPDRAGTASEEEAQDGMLRWLEHYAH